MEKSHYREGLSDLEIKHRELAVLLESNYKKFGANYEDFHLVTIEEDKGLRYFVAYAAPEGLDLGEGLRGWNNAFSPANEDIFVFSHDDTKVDTRQGMTKKVYCQLHDRLASAGFPIDSLPVASNRVDKDDELPWSYRWTSTMLTGEVATVNDHQYAISNIDGKVKFDWCSRQYNGANMRFRPVLEIEL